ncbi:hypothetical protein ASD65_12010 [Microbacterium sp. Root61]|uniref:hypothetical protein n=1 Tax=Microbacterium sp. Root61 TaxID=1736570 RepID=UPI0006F317D5|nr:hypothetical protein [Microbacterium sp. Root61]KRA25068.1 hypothetical protein ASD65_12010 [Microbacterium sp. Root61]
MTLAPTIVTPRRFLASLTGLPHGITRVASARAFSTIAGLLAIGVALAILTTPDPLWWHLHFSHLGTFPVLSGAIFNATIMTTGTLIALLSRRVYIELRAHVARSRSHRRSPIVLSTLTASVGLHLTGVGLVPIDTLTALHEGLAFGIPISVAAMMIAAPALLRGTGRPLGKRTIPAAGALVGAYVVMNLGFINLAAFELIGFTAMFVWMTMFLGCLVPRAAASAPETAPAGRMREIDGHHAVASAARLAGPALGLSFAPLVTSRSLDGDGGATVSCLTPLPHRAISVSSAPRAHPKGGHGPAPATSGRSSDISPTRSLFPPVLRQTVSSGRLSRSPVCSSSVSA